jgi:hypothetical protein
MNPSLDKFYSRVRYEVLTSATTSTVFWGAVACSLKKLKAVVWLLSGTHDHCLSVWQLRVSWCGAPSLTRGFVCNLLVLLLLGLAKAATLGSKSRRTFVGLILLSHLWLPQRRGPGPRIYLPQEHGGPVIPTVTGLPFVAFLRLAGLPAVELPVSTRVLYNLVNNVLYIHQLLGCSNAKAFSWIPWPRWLRLPLYKGSID